MKTDNLIFTNICPMFTQFQRLHFVSEKFNQATKLYIMQEREGTEQLRNYYSHTKWKGQNSY